MKWGDYRRVRMSAIAVDTADIAARMKDPRVGDLAEDIRQAGEEPIHAPTVRAGSMVLVCGRDRYSALSLLKAKRIWVRTVECSDLEAQQLERRENLRRRQDNRAQLLAELVTLKEQQLRETIEITPSPRRDSVTPSGQTIKAQARKEVAREAGVTAATVRQAEHRVKARSRPFGEAPERSTSDAEKALEMPDGFEMFGESIPPSWRASILADIGDLEEWHRQAVDAENAIRIWLQRPTMNIRRVKLEGIKSAALAFSLAIANARPEALCAWCHGARCKRCDETGLAGRFDNEAFHEEKAS